MVQISLLQPRHTYAPEEGEGQVYLPNSLLTAAARIMHAGGDVVDIQDANLRPWHSHADIIGVNLLGAPYIPEVREKIAKVLGPTIPLAVGGQVINGLVVKDKFGMTKDRTQLTRLFGSSVINGNDDREMTAALGIDSMSMPALAETSVVPAYERIGDEDMKKYLSKEFSFHLSQGCKWFCKFCAAVRTMKDPLSGVATNVTESYRRPSVLERDFRYLLERAERLELSRLDIYLSNLDVFQTPAKLLEFAEIVKAMRQSHPGISVGMRALSTVSSFLEVHERHPEVIAAMVEAGFHTAGFGIDGMTPKIWASVRKGHNTENKCLDAIRIAREEYGITPEILMVFGGEEETEDSLKKALTFTADMVKNFGAVPRPHVSKDLVPGNELWRKKENAERVEELIKHPEYFQALDFTALPSGISHPDESLRRLVATYYIELTQISGNATELVYPISPEMDEETKALHRRLNIGKFDR
jgi:hypothetical protein